MQKWKQTLGDRATYKNLIAAFENAGYQDYADFVYKIIGNMHAVDIYPDYWSIDP